MGPQTYIHTDPRLLPTLAKPHHTVLIYAPHALGTCPNLDSWRAHPRRLHSHTTVSSAPTQINNTHSATGMSAQKLLDFMEHFDLVSAMNIDPTRTSPRKT